MDTIIFKNIEQYLHWVDINVNSELDVKTEITMLEMPMERTYLVNIWLGYMDYEGWIDDEFIQIECKTMDKALTMQRYVEMVMK